MNELIPIQKEGGFSAPAPAHPERHPAFPASTCSSLVKIAARLLRSCNAPSELDQIDWYKTTPLKERRRMIRMFREIDEEKRQFACEINRLRKDLEKQNA